MNGSDALSFVPLRAKTLPDLTRIMKRAFDEDTRLHLGRSEGGPPGYDDGSFLKRYGLDAKATSFELHLGNRLIGGLILWLDEVGQEGYLGTIFLDPALQNQGLGSKIWQQVERRHPKITFWATETPLFSRRNHAFYVNKCGFHIVRIENPCDLELGTCHLEKHVLT